MPADDGMPDASPAVAIRQKIIILFSIVTSFYWRSPECGHVLNIASRKKQLRLIPTDNYRDPYPLTSVTLQ
jgi:hypothetical protein